MFRGKTKKTAETSVKSKKGKSKRSSDEFVFVDESSEPEKLTSQAEDKSRKSKHKSSGESEDFIFVDESESQSKGKEHDDSLEKPTEEIVITSNPPNDRFQVGRQLAPEDIYRVSVGLFDERDYELVKVIADDNFAPESNRFPEGSKEVARVYRNPDDGKLHIVYYPGKDNDKPFGPGDTVEPLKRIIDYYVDPQLEKVFSHEELQQAEKHFIICESNTYYGFKVNHFIRAHLDQGILTTEDSINRSYDESYISSAIPHTQRSIIKTGYQTMIINDWACGFFSNESLRRQLFSQNRPSKLDIDARIVAEHSRLHYKGKIKIEEQKNARDKHADDINLVTYSNWDLPVGGSLGTRDPECQLSIVNFEKGLGVNARDRNVRLLVTGETDTALIIRAYTKNNIPALDSLGIDKHTNQHGRQYYELHVRKDVKTLELPGQPLLGIALETTDSIKMVDVSHLYSVNDLTSIRRRVNENEGEAPVLDMQDKKPQDQNNVFEKIQAVNQYLKKRAQKTSGFLSFVAGSYTGEDYYARRRSWKLILDKFNQLADHKIDAAALRQFIVSEAKKFKKGLGSSNEFHDKLMALHNVIDDEFDPSPELSARIANYFHIYNDMDVYKSAARQYVRHFSWFRSDDATREEVRRERTLYAEHYKLLDDDDRNDFLSPEEEHLSEYNNMVHYKN